MLIKGLITTAVVGLALPVLAVGIAGGVMLANTQKKRLGCRDCCMFCNGSCKTGDNYGRNNKERDLQSEALQS